MKASKRNAGEDKDTQAGDEGAEAPPRKMSKVIANKTILFFNCKYKAKIMFIVVMDKDLQ